MANSQDFETQELTQKEESSQNQTQYYSFKDSEDVNSIWGTVEITNRIIKLYSNFIHFGRTFSNLTFTGDQCEILTRVDIPEKLDFQRMSSHHFTIKRLLKDDRSGFPFHENSTPAVIICKGRNGIIVDDVELALGEKKVLKHNSIIRLIKSHNLLCRFKYDWGSNVGVTTSTDLTDKYFIGQVVGSGACGSVRVILPLKKTRENVEYKVLALKTISYNSTNSLTGNESVQTYEGVMNEVKIMKKLNFRHVMGLENHFVTERSVHLVFEFMGGGDLLSRITESRKKYLKESDAKFLFHQLLLGVSYLHENGITHRDIKAENVFLSDKSSSPLLKIGDFGLSKMQYVMNTKCGTFLYAAPEVLKNISSYTHKVDIWSLGCLLYAMLSGKVPFPEGPDMHYRIYKAKYSFNSFKNVSKEAKYLIKHMLQPLPKSRVEAREMLDSSWITQDRVHAARLKHSYKEHGFVEEEEEQLTNELERTLVIDEEAQLNYKQDDSDIENNDGPIPKRQRIY